VKKILIGLALVLLSLSLYGVQVHAGPPDTPFPLDYPVKFPWNSIEGVWQVASGSGTSLFSFEVQNDCEGRQILKVFQVDAATNDVIAEGTGFKLDNSFEIYAVMKGEGVENYVIHIGAYRDTHSYPMHKVIVLRVLPFTSTERGEQDFKIVKMPGSIPVKRIDDASTPCNLK